MTRRIEHLAFYLLIAAAVLLVLWAVRWWRGRCGGAFCPGKRRPWSGWLFPWKWLVAGTCGYDLRGTPVGAGGIITCSECGRQHRSLKSAWRSRRRWRLGAAAAAMVAISCAGYSVRPIRKGTWTRRAPTDALLVMQQSLGQWSSRHIRRELGARLDRNELSDRQRQWLAGVAVQALGDDYESWNALWAMDVLPALGEHSSGALLAGLDSPDWQRRQLCAEVLRDRIVPRWREVGPHIPRQIPTRLIEVSVEGLADDALPFGRASRLSGRTVAETWINNARSSVEFLAYCGPETEPFIAVALNSKDPQQLFLAACAAGFARCDGLSDPAVERLVPHLKNDGIECNAKLAAAAIFAFGERARPTIEALALESADSQQKRIANRILIEWSGPAGTEAESAARNRVYADWRHEPFWAVRLGRAPSFHPFPDLP